MSNNQIYKHLTALLGELASSYTKKTLYSNNETVYNRIVKYQNYEITFETHRITTIYNEKLCTYREHYTLKSIVQEIQEVKKPIFNYSMFEDIV